MVSKKILNKATKQLVEKFHPKKIILFGSQARGTADEHSDVDLLVICPIKGNRHNLMVKMNSILGELDYAFEAVVLTSEEFERDSRIPGTIGRYASQEGKILYEHSR